MAPRDDGGLGADAAPGGAELSGASAITGVPPSCLYTGRVVHTRVQPVSHHLEYRVFSLFLDIDRVGELARESRIFGHNRWRPISFHDRDHGPHDGCALRPWVDKQLVDFGLIPGGPVRLLCFPRLWGYVFNPLSVYYCYRNDGQMQAVLYEVANTFGEWHLYVLPVESAGRDATGIQIRQETEKVFHVSPFNRVEGSYRFRLTRPGERMALTIRETEASGADILHATHTARRRDFSDRHLARALMRHPLMTVKVIAAIHWEALKLWRKGLPFHRKPEPPRASATGQGPGRMPR